TRLFTSSRRSTEWGPAAWGCGPRIRGGRPPYHCSTVRFWPMSILLVREALLGLDFLGARTWRHNQLAAACKGLHPGAPEMVRLLGSWMGWPGSQLFSGSG